MNKLIQWIGSAVFAAVMYAVPILMTLSFALNWGGEWKFIHFLFALGQFIVLVCCVYENVEVNK